MKLLDTGFLIDLQREWARRKLGAAHRFMREHADEEFALSVISMLEFLEGYRQVRAGEDFLDPFLKLPVDENVSRLGSRVRRSLREQGEPIGDYDVVIAATAITAGAELVTADVEHFRRVEGLDMASYRP